VHGDDATIAEEGDDERDQREDKAMAMSRVLEPAVTARSDEVDPLLPPGTNVEVRNRLDGQWARGFEVITSDRNGYRLRRLSDGGELPLLFHDDDVRKEKKRGTWWY
jgi:hypothetical protein